MKLIRWWWARLGLGSKVCLPGLRSYGYFITDIGVKYVVMLLQLQLGKHSTLYLYAFFVAVGDKSFIKLLLKLFLFSWLDFLTNITFNMCVSTYTLSYYSPILNILLCNFIRETFLMKGPSRKNNSELKYLRNRPSKLFIIYDSTWLDWLGALIFLIVANQSRFFRDGPS